MDKYFAVLRACPLFDAISDADLEAIMHCLGASYREYKKGQIILAEGDPADTLGIVLRGTARVSRVDYYGNRSIVASLEPPDIFGETYAFSGIDALPVSVIAGGDCAALLIRAQRISRTCQSACAFHSQMIYNLLHILAAKNLRFSQKNEITARKTTREKLLAYLHSEAKKNTSSTFTIPYDRQELADYLAVDRSGLSAEISKLRREGVLESRKNEFRLLAPPVQ